MSFTKCSKRTNIYIYTHTCNKTYMSLEYFSLLLRYILGVLLPVIVPPSHHVLGGLLDFLLNLLILLLVSVNPSFQKNDVLPFLVKFFLH
jgi:hypothetical protein